MMRIVKYILKKKGLLCMMCADAFASEPKQLCKDCANELFLIEMADYYRDELEMMR
tara:strand:+ start:3839 stop:4006 length:168 start_codon:yes stop_codon:yes gene_type:complete